MRHLPAFALLFVSMMGASTPGGASAPGGASFAAVQDPAPDQEPKAPEKLDAWPAVADADQVDTDIKRLRKAATEAMATEGHAGLVRAGAGVAPDLLKVLGKERDEEARARIARVLDAVVGAPHTRLLAEYLASKRAPVRRWSMQRAAAFPDAGLREAADAALESTRALVGKKRADEEDLYLAALCATSTGSYAGLEELFARAAKSWGKHGAELRTALEAVRGEPATRAIGKRLESSKREDKITALRMLAGCGDASARGLVRGFLDSTDNGLRIGAINALRGIVDGDPPLDRLPVFEAIDVAKKWKARV